jgi:nucleoside-diphosphate-sugar epimerase
MTTLVTGAFGHLGGHVTSAVARHDTVILASRRDRDDTRGMVRRGDLLDESSLRPLVDGVDIVVHLAALSDTESTADPVLATKVNVEGTAALVRAAENAGVRRFIYASTVQVFGDALRGTVSEVSPTGKSGPYASTHLAAENVVRNSTMEHSCLRLANGFGRPVDPTVDTWRLLVADMCKRAVTDGHLELRSHGRHERDFVPVTDLAAALAHFARTADVLPPVVIIGSGRSTTLLDMAERVAARARMRLGRDMRVSTNPSDDSPAQTYRLDVSLMRGCGFRPALDIDTTIDDLLDLALDSFGGRS